MKKDNTGISPVVGTILLIAITVALAVVVAVMASSMSSRGAPPFALLKVTASGSSATNGTVDITIDHQGGDAIPMSDMTLKAWNIDNALVDVPMTGPAVLTIGDTMTGHYIYDPHAASRTNSVVVRVVVIHNPSKTFILDMRPLVI